ncbi:hypothetical protein FKB34_14670 [Glycocaulis profundi]|nr:hypothetical protein FKB34_14670 [Glycocaulis profundi]
MISLRARLLLILLPLTCLVWAGATVWIHAGTQTRIERVLDARLAESAQMVASLVRGGGLNPGADGAAGLTPVPGAYGRQLSCQIWSMDGDLLSRSDAAPDAVLSGHQSGFADAEIEGEAWRVYAVTDAELGVRVLVGDSLRSRQRLADDVALGLLVPALLMLPLLIALIWWSVGRGLRPLDTLARRLEGRSATDLSPVAMPAPPAEIRPAVSALDALLDRVRAARERERDFIAYAAHELRTPLAGLKTQAQVARAAGDDAQARDRALQAITRSVDRSARLIGQLLDMAGLDADAAPLRIEAVSLPGALARIEQDLASVVASRAARIVADLPPEGGALRTDARLLDIILRNLIDNAVRHGPDGGTVRVTARRDHGRLEITVDDDGPGLTPEDRERVFERFHRAAPASVDGSGLGLPLARMAAMRLGGALTLQPRAPGGLRAVVTLPLAPA